MEYKWYVLDGPLRKFDMWRSEVLGSESYLSVLAASLDCTQKSGESTP
jgi:hypothetical protein